MIVIALIAGALGVVLSLALRRDTTRARQVVQSGGVLDQRFVYVLLPGFSLLLVGMGGLGLVLPGVGGALGNFLGPLLAALCALVTLAGSGPAPNWALPAWVRKGDKDSGGRGGKRGNGKGRKR